MRLTVLGGTCLWSLAGPTEVRADGLVHCHGSGEEVHPLRPQFTQSCSPQLFQKCCLVQRILEAWEANDHTQ